MYLLSSLCHPPHQPENIPYILAMRINRVFTFPETRDTRLVELKQMLLNRDYRPGMVDAAITKARNLPREIALRKVVKPKQSTRPVAVVSWDPRLSNLDKIQQKLWRSMTLDPYLKEVYPQPPLLAYRRPKNKSEYLIKARVPPPNQTTPSRQLKGMKKCKTQCIICPFIKEGKTIKSKYVHGELRQMYHVRHKI